MNKYRLIFTILSCTLLISNLYSNVSSQTGTIKFNVNYDNSPEAYLNSSGLGLGTSNISSNLHVMGNTIIENGSLMLGTTSSHSTLELSGSIGFSIESISSNTTLSNNSYVLVDTSNNSILLTLPYAGNTNGRTYSIKKISSNNKLYISGGGNSIDDIGALELNSTTSSLPFINMISNGIQWYITSSSGNLNTIGSDNLVAWWKFDETSGTTAFDSSSNGNDATLQNGFTFSSNSTLGKLNRALALDGDDDQLTTPDLNLTNSFSIAFYMIIKGQLDSSFASVIAINGGNRFLWQFSNGTFYSPEVVMTTVLATNEWIHVVYSFDEVNSKEYLYVNGAQVNQRTTSTPSWSGTGFIGAHATNDVYNFYGCFDEIRIYNSPLNLYEIQALNNLY